MMRLIFATLSDVLPMLVHLQWRWWQCCPLERVSLSVKNLIMFQSVNASTCRVNLVPKFKREIGSEDRYLQLCCVQRSWNMYENVEVRVVQGSEVDRIMVCSEARLLS